MDILFVNKFIEVLVVMAEFGMRIERKIDNILLRASPDLKTYLRLCSIGMPSQDSRESRKIIFVKFIIFLMNQMKC